MEKRRAFTLVELLVVIAIIAVLLAILMPALGGMKNLAKRTRCTSNLNAIGKAFTMYVGAYDNALPTLQYYAPGDQVIEHFYGYKWADPYTPSKGDVWIHMGCLYAQGLIDNAKVFYCPAAEGWEEEYHMNVNPPTYKWGERPFESNFCKAIKGYSYWPMSKTIYKTSAELNAIHPSTARPNYSLGYPRTPTIQSDLNQGKALAVDYAFHFVKGTGWNLNALFPDGHVLFQKQPTNAQGLGLWHDWHEWPSGVINTSNGQWLDPDEQARNVPTPAPIVEMVFALQP